MALYVEKMSLHRKECKYQEENLLGNESAKKKMTNNMNKTCREDEAAKKRMNKTCMEEESAKKRKIVARLVLQ